MQLELPLYRPDKSKAASALRRLGVRDAQWWCTACDFEGPHTSEQCAAMCPQCHVDGCERVTCIQARYHGKVPTCLDHFFGSSPDWKAEIPDA